MRATSLVAILSLALPLVACGTKAQDRRAHPPDRLVAEAVAALQRDLVTRNWADVCTNVFSAAARSQAGGDSCPDFVRQGAAGLRGERIRIRSIELRGARASANVITTADGQAPVPETIELVLEGGRFRIDSLAR